MVQTVDPFQKFEKMVDEDGKPTDYFLRQWQFLIDAVLETTANEEGLAGLTNTVSANTQAITAVQNIDLTAGVGLDGGGDLTADRTFDLADTAVTPGQFGNATNVGQFTVDQQGRITQAANVAITGGGGGGVSWAWLPNVTGTDSFARPTKGNMVVPFDTINITRMAANITTTAGATYKFYVLRLDGSDNVDEITGISADVASPGAFAEVTIVADLLATAVLNPGSRYTVMVGRTDGGDSFALVIAINVSANDISYPMLPLKLFAESAADPTNLTFMAHAVPAIGDAVTISTSGRTFGVGLQFSL